MKLHAFEVEIEGVRWRAFTRDKSGKALKKQTPTEDIGTTFLPGMWKYSGIEFGKSALRGVLSLLSEMQSQSDSQ